MNRGGAGGAVHALILIEGIPGAGKTTTAERTCALLRSRGVDAHWYDELDPLHPATPKDLRKLHRQPGFAELCLQSWKLYVAERSLEGEVHVLESSAFQDTVRFMFAEGRSANEIRAYFDAFERVVDPLAPWFVYLEPLDAAAHTRDFVIPTRGPEWTRKLCSYVAGTPIAERRGWSGEVGMVAFWAEYAALCAVLVDELKWPVLRLELPEPDWRDADRRLQGVIGERF